MRLEESHAILHHSRVLSLWHLENARQTVWHRILHRVVESVPEELIRYTNVDHDRRDDVDTAVQYKTDDDLDDDDV